MIVSFMAGADVALFCADELGHGSKKSTVPVVHGEPGGEVQVDLGRLGYLTTGRGLAGWCAR